MTSSISLNPFALCDVTEMSELLTAMCGTGLTAAQAAFMKDEVQALAPALVFLRDAGRIELDTRRIAQYASPEGFHRVSLDDALPDDLRVPCARLHKRMVEAQAQAAAVLLKFGCW